MSKIQQLHEHNKYIRTNITNALEQIQQGIVLHRHHRVSHKSGSQWGASKRTVGKSVIDMDDDNEEDHP